MNQKPVMSELQCDRPDKMHWYVETSWGSTWLDTDGHLGTWPLSQGEDDVQLRNYVLCIERYLLAMVENGVLDCGSPEPDHDSGSGTMPRDRRQGRRTQIRYIKQAENRQKTDM